MVLFIRQSLPQYKLQKLCMNHNSFLLCGVESLSVAYLCGRCISYTVLTLNIMMQDLNEQSHLLCPLCIHSGIQL
jgi:hypothetical protein